jgi:hypothetical protein
MRASRRLDDIPGVGPAFAGQKDFLQDEELRLRE